MRLYVFAAILLFTCAVCGQPLPPCDEVFWGNVTINGSIAPNGTIASAWINNVMMDSCETENWKGTAYGKVYNYMLHVGGKSGDIIEFKIYNATVHTDTLDCGETTNLDLHLWDEDVDESAQISINYTEGKANLTVEWTAGRDTTGISHYELWRRYESENFTLVARLNATDREYTDTNLLSGNYTYKLCTVDFVGNKNCTEANVTVVGGVEGGKIIGSVTYTCNNTGIPNVSVSLMRDGEIIRDTKTNETGQFLFEDLSEGNYSIKVSKPHFFDNETDVSLISGDESDVSLRMWIKGDLNNNGKSADAGDVSLMLKGSVLIIEPDWRYDLNNNGKLADAGDVLLILKASVGYIELI